MRMEFKDYKDYSEYVSEEWEFGNINELEEDGLIVFNTTVWKSGVETKTYRKLTEEEFNKINNG